MDKPIKLSAGLRTIAGAKEVIVHIDAGVPVRTLLQALQQVNPALGAHILDGEGALLPGIQLLVSGRHIDFLQGLDTPIRTDDNLMLIPPIAGG